MSPPDQKPNCTESPSVFGSGILPGILGYLLNAGCTAQPKTARQIGNKFSSFLPETDPDQYARTRGLQERINPCERVRFPLGG